MLAWTPGGGWNEWKNLFHLASRLSGLHPQPLPPMASSYPPPFEGTGEVKEGFICPLCHKDLQSFYQLQDHYEEEHSGDDRHVRGQLKSKCTTCNICDNRIYVRVN